MPIDTLPHIVLGPAALHFDLPDGLPAGGGGRVAVPITVERQIGDFTCWAAIAATLSRYRNHRAPQPPWTQCELASDQVAPGHQCCGGAGLPDSCDQKHYLDKALDRTGNLTTADPLQRAASELAAELAAQNPVAIAVEWPNGGGFHFVLVVGVDPGAPGGPEVVISDPLYGRWVGDLAALDGEYQQLGGTWVATYLTC